MKPLGCYYGYGMFLLLFLKRKLPASIISSIKKKTDFAKAFGAICEEITVEEMIEFLDERARHNESIRRGGYGALENRVHTSGYNVPPAAAQISMPYSTLHESKKEN